jgi:surface protein
MSYMFNGCNSLENIDLSNFNTENITSMNSMFYGCNSIKDLNLSYFITRNST